MQLSLRVMYPLCHILMKLEFSRHFRKKPLKYEMFTKIRPVGTELFNENGMAERRTDW